MSVRNKIQNTAGTLILLLFVVFGAFAQKEKPLITIGKTKVSKGEFERIYKKNNSNLYNESDQKSPEEYLDLFINFKLKVLEAENLKMDTSKAFINELDGYRTDLAVPYLTDVKYNEKMIEELYDRMKKEVSASHILFKLAENATPEEEQKVLDKANAVRQEIINGKDFNEAAFEYSEDPSAKTNNGNLGYFSAFQMVVPFENAAFNTPVGETSQPVRSSFGYHLIKVNDVRENQGEIKVAHIMKMFPQTATSETSADEIRNNLKKVIDNIYQLVLNGMDFAEAAKKYSDDKRSSGQGGEMPWFTAGRMIPEFAAPAFALQNKDDISAPIQTAFGWHIIKKLDSRKIKPFEEVRDEIEERIKKDPLRSITSKKAFVEKLKVEYNFSENNKNIEKIKELKIEDDVKELKMNLFSLDGRNYSFEKFKAYLNDKEIKGGYYFHKLENWIEYEITKLEDSKLEEKYDDFRFLMQEYHDGILLFNISEDKIWNFAVEDSLGLWEFYKTNKNKYSWEERFKGKIIICKNKEIREDAEKYFAAGMSTDEVNDLINKEDDFVTIKEGAWEKGSHPIVDYFVWNGPEPEHFNGEVTFIRGDKISPEPKSLSEARGLYISDYQNFLEKKWIKELKKKYKIKVNKKLLKSVTGV